MLRRVRASVRIAGLVVFGPGHTRHAPRSFAASKESVSFASA